MLCRGSQPQQWKPKIETLCQPEDREAQNFSGGPSPLQIDNTRNVYAEEESLVGMMGACLKRLGN
jgi:hypothetical protein